MTGPAAAPLAYADAAPATAQLGAGLTPTLWAPGYGGWGNTSGNGNAASLSNTIGGFLMGADVAVADNARAGVYGGFSRSTFDVSGRASSGAMDNYDVGVYAGAPFGAVAARGGLAYAWHDVSVDRTISFSDFLQAASSDYSSRQHAGVRRARLRHDTRVVRCGAVRRPCLPEHRRRGVPGERRIGGAVGECRVDGTIYTTLGVRAATSVDLFGHALTPSVTLGWQHAFGDTSPTASMLLSGGTAPFQVSGARCRGCAPAGGGAWLCPVRSGGALRLRKGIDRWVIVNVPGLSPEGDQSATALVGKLLSKAALTTVSYETEAGLLQKAGWSSVVCGPGDILQAHRSNEFIERSELVAGINVLARLKQALC